MKLLVAISIVLLPACLSGQIVINQSDMPQTGDTIRLSHTVNFGQIDPEDTGPAHTWDFSALSPVYQSVDTFYSVTQTPFVYQLFFLLTANLAQKQAEFDQLPGFEVSDTYTFYKNSSSSYKSVGFGVTLNGLPMPTLFDDPDVIYHFPVEAGGLDSSFSSYTFDIPGIGYFGGWKKRNNTADGWGTLITPYGSFETLRVKAEIKQYDSIYIDSLGFGMPVYLESTEYKWLAKGKGLPVCELLDNGLVQTINYIDSVRSIISGGVESVTGPGMNILPNPARDRVTIVLDGPATRPCIASLYNANGNAVFVETILSHGGSLSIDLRPYRLGPGVYFLVVRTDEHVFTGKLFVH